MAKPKTLKELAEEYMNKGTTNNKKTAMLMAQAQKAEEKAKQKKIELAQAKRAEEKLKKEKARKDREHHLIQVGGLFEKAGIDKKHKNLLFGAFLYINSLLEGQESEKHQKRFFELNDQFYANKSHGEECIIHIELSKEHPDFQSVKSQIKEQGFRWNPSDARWEGKGTKKIALELENMIADYGKMKFFKG